MADIAKDGSLAKETKNEVYHLIIRFRLANERLAWTQETKENVVSFEHALVLRNGGEINNLGDQRSESLTCWLSMPSLSSSI